MEIPEDLKAEYEFAQEIWSEHTDPNDTDARHYRREANLIERIAKCEDALFNLQEKYARKVKALRDIQRHLRAVAPQFTEYSGVWKIVEDALMDDGKD